MITSQLLYTSSCQFIVDEISTTPQKLCNNFFRGAQELVLVQQTLIMQKIITKKTLMGAFLGTPLQNALYHTVQMVLVDHCDKLIICFLWVLKGGKHNY